MLDINALTFVAASVYLSCCQLHRVYILLPRDAMHKRDLCRHAVSVCVCVCVCVSRS